MGVGIHRVFIKTPINDDRLNKPFEVGEIIISDSDYNWLKNNYPDFVVEVPMSEQEWLQYYSNEVHKSYEKAIILERICEQFGLEVELPIAFDSKTASLGSVAANGGMLDPELYGGGITDVINKAYIYKTDIEDYEKRVFSAMKSISITR